jgi:hypothetical protein
MNKLSALIEESEENGLLEAVKYNEHYDCNEEILTVDLVFDQGDFVVSL